MFKSSVSEHMPSRFSKIRSNSVRNIEKTGAGMFNVGAKTMPTFLTVILLTSELFTMIIKNWTNARSKAKFGLGSLWTSELNAAILSCLSLSSGTKTISINIRKHHSTSISVLTKYSQKLDMKFTSKNSSGQLSQILFEKRGHGMYIVILITGEKVHIPFSIEPFFERLDNDV